MGAWSDLLLAARGVVPSVRAPLPLRRVWEAFTPSTRLHAIAQIESRRAGRATR